MSPDEIPKLHLTSLAGVRMHSGKVFVELDDASEKRLQIVFSPMQALRVTTADCFSARSATSFVPQKMTEVRESTWIRELRGTLRKVDEGANFLDRSHHYLIPGQDEIIEIVAWSFEWEYVA